MKLVYYKGAQPNFGDDLNPWLWSKLLPNTFDDDDSTVFMGIGSIIGADFTQQYGPATPKIVFGSGFVSTYATLPDVSGKDWRIAFVRGPRTAKALNLDPTFAVGDSATLIRTVIPIRNTDSGNVSFMPHWESLNRGKWEKVCRLLGFKMIDPRGTVDEVIAELQRTKLLITEAMHGAIVADALRIPWIPAQPIHDAHRDKWFDWAESLSLNLSPYKMLPSNVTEATVNGRRRYLSSPLIAPIADSCFAYASALRLYQISRMPPCLSADSKINSLTERMIDHVTRFKMATI